MRRSVGVAILLVACGSTSTTQPLSVAPGDGGAAGEASDPTPTGGKPATIGASGSATAGGIASTGGEPTTTAGQGGAPTFTDAGQGGMPIEPVAGQAGAHGGEGGAPVVVVPNGGAGAAGETTIDVGGAGLAGMAGDGGAGGVPESPKDPFGCAQPPDSTIWKLYTVQPGQCLTAGAYAWKGTPSYFYIWSETSPANYACDAVLGGWVSVRPGENGAPITLALAVTNTWPAGVGEAILTNVEGNVQAGKPFCANLPLGLGY